MNVITYSFILEFLMCKEGKGGHFKDFILLIQLFLLVNITHLNFDVTLRRGSLNNISYSAV